MILDQNSYSITFFCQILVNPSFRPVGNKVLLDCGTVDNALLGTTEPIFYQSGTAALSSSVIACIQLKGIQTSQAEVIVPAYACPDLISAIVFSGAKPVPADICKNSPGYLISQLECHISSRTVAIIAVNFLGIADQLSKIKVICQYHNLFLINDSAQWFPSSKTYRWLGDFNIVSFGRGKPVSLLHGGAVITNNTENSSALLKPITGESKVLDTLLKILKIRLYNLVIKPRVYALIRKLPGLNIGETIYKPLDSINGMDVYEKQRIGPNIREYQALQNVTSYWQSQLLQVTHTLLIKPVEDTKSEVPSRLLRYPILIKDSKIRDNFCTQNRELGVSFLYPKPLNQLEGLSSLLNSKKVYPNASEFCDQLVTLPCHEDITEATVDKIITSLKSHLGITS